MGGGEERREGGTRGSRHRCLVKPLEDQVMHTTSSSADLASDGYELGQDVTAGKLFDSRGEKDVPALRGR